MSAGLSDFLLARIAEDEAMAQGAVVSPWEAVTDDHGRGRSREHSVWSGDMHGSYVAEWIAARADADHIARWDPARVLAECEARRRIVKECGWVTVMRLLALPHADHPDFDPSWRP